MAASADRKLNVVENAEITSSPSNRPELERALRILECQMEEANGDPSGKGEECLRSLGIEPTTAAEWNNQGWARFNHHRYEEAISDFTHALELAPD